MPPGSRPWRAWTLDMTNGLAIDDLRLAICDWLSAIGSTRLALGGWRWALAYLELGTLVVLLTLLPACSRSPAPPSPPGHLPPPPVISAPTALALSPDGQNLYIACAAAKQVLVFDTGQPPDHQTAGAAG